MQIKTNELTGAALDWAVAKCEGYALDPAVKKHAWIYYSTDWAYSGPIIERECMDILCLAGGDDGWQADKYLHTEKVEGFGPTPLIAAMRCYVASKLGDTVDIPEELV